MSHYLHVALWSHTQMTGSFSWSKIAKTHSDMTTMTLDIHSPSRYYGRPYNEVAWKVGQLHAMRGTIMHWIAASHGTPHEKEYESDLWDAFDRATQLVRLAEDTLHDRWVHYKETPAPYPKPRTS